MGWESGLVLGLDAGLALGGAILDLTPPIWDGRLDLFWDWMLDCCQQLLLLGLLLLLLLLPLLLLLLLILGWESGLVLGLDTAMLAMTTGTTTNYLATLE